MSDTKWYLDYLDKEMTIMGILSTFCVAAAALVPREILNAAGDGAELIRTDRPDATYVVTGCGLMMAAAAAFYWQRAQLAWHYGRISLWATDSKVSESPLSKLLQDSDTWTMWVPYQEGLWFAAGALASYFGAVLPIPPEYERYYVSLVIVSVVAAVCATALLRWSRDKSDRSRKQGSRRRRRGHRRLRGEELADA